MQYARERTNLLVYLAKISPEEFPLQDDLVVLVGYKDQMKNFCSMLHGSYQAPQ